MNSVHSFRCTTWLAFTERMACQLTAKSTDKQQPPPELAASALGAQCDMAPKGPHAMPHGAHRTSAHAKCRGVCRMGHIGACRCGMWMWDVGYGVWRVPLRRSQHIGQGTWDIAHRDIAHRDMSQAITCHGIWGTKRRAGGREQSAEPVAG
jgi:hypothetical protein